MGQSGKQHMVSTAGINDQELTIAAEFTSVDDPSVARRGDLGALPRLDDQSLRPAPIRRRLAEGEHAPSLRGFWQLRLGEMEWNRGLHAPRTPGERSALRCEFDCWARQAGR